MAQKKDYNGDLIL